MLVAYVLGFLALPISGLASPLLTKREVDNTTFTNIAYYGQYASASYCNANFGGSSTKVACRVNNCKDVQNADQTIVNRFFNQSITGTTGFVAVDRTKQLIVVSFRGTQSFENLKALLKLGMVDTGICTGCKAHEGFNQAWLDVKDTVVGEIRKQISNSANAKFKVVVTGHSLGAAIATVAAADLRSTFPVVDLAAFASPRVGNSNLVAKLTATGKGQNFRISQLNDIVPDVPPAGDFNGTYAHILPWYQINSPAPTALTPTTRRNINRIATDTANSPNVNIANVAFRLPTHNYYINNIASCGETSVGAIVTARQNELKPLIRDVLKKFPALEKDPAFGPIIKFLVAVFRIGSVEAQEIVRTA